MFRAQRVKFPGICERNIKSSQLCQVTKKKKAEAIRDDERKMSAERG